MPTVLFTAPYMIPFVDRFKPVFEKYGIELIIADVRERMEEADLLNYAGRFDGAICGDDRYTERVIQLCSPRLKVISKWGTGVDSIDAVIARAAEVKAPLLAERLSRINPDGTIVATGTVAGWSGKSGASRGRVPAVLRRSSIAWTPASLAPRSGSRR